MSLILSYSKPSGIEVKTWGEIRKDERGKQIVDFGSFMSPIIEIPMDDFVKMVEYVLTNSKLEKNDPRIYLIERIQKLKITKNEEPGWPGTRLKHIEG